MYVANLVQSLALHMFPWAPLVVVSKQHDLWSKYQKYKKSGVGGDRERTGTKHGCFIEQKG